MGHRFRHDRHYHTYYSERRWGQIINSARFRPGRRMRAYGWNASGYERRSIWEVDTTRPGKQAEWRYPKKSARQQARHELYKYKEEY